MNLINEVKLSVVATSQAAGQTEVDTSILDMAGYDSVMFIALLGTVSAGSVLTLTAEQNTANSTSGMAAIVDATTGTNAAATVTDVGGATSNGALVVDVYRPQDEFVRAALTRTTANAAVNGIVALQYNAKKRPTVQDATVMASRFAVGS